MRDLVGDVQVRRVLPRGGHGVGPFIFLDHMGPWDYKPGISSVDVAPHPHIGLSTLTYLFAGELVHRDSMGNVQTIRPGAVNWMMAGKGVVHSERMTESHRNLHHEVHGLQAWVTLPEADELAAPKFQHHGAETIPEFMVGSAKVRLIAGQGFGKASPVRVSSRLFYMTVDIPAGQSFEFESDGDEIAVYLFSGLLKLEDKEISKSVLIQFRTGFPVKLKAEADTHILLLGGQSLGPRHIWWNFVSSSQERIEAAKQAWKLDQFPPVPGETERIPLPG